jgi:FAD/FMN-containing dehydrogenase
LIYLRFALPRFAAAEGGSISAEHGLGLMKAPHVHYSKTDDAVQMMRSIKQVFDPKGIMSASCLLPLHLLVKRLR